MTIDTSAPFEDAMRVFSSMRLGRTVLFGGNGDIEAGR